MAKTLSAIRHCLLAGSSLLLACVLLCYWGRFDFCTAATVYPPWCWAGTGMLMVCIAISRQTRLVGAVLMSFWLVSLTVLSDSPFSLIRTWLPEAPTSTRFRVVSLNCASSAVAAREVISFQPDIVLLQESPARAELVAIGESLFGPGNHVHWGIDASIVARGEVVIVDTPLSQRGNFVHARVQIGESSVEVISLRLIPSVFRMDLWSLRCWEAFRTNRVQRREQLGITATHLQSIPVDAPVILGGDFNAPPGDAVFRLLRPRLSDSFTSAGRGWGATILNELPAIRIDQIWASAQVTPLAVTAHETQHSDHRMVVADFIMDHPQH